MTQDGRIFYFMSAATIKQPLELLFNEINVRKGYKKGRKVIRDEDVKEIIPS
jgi:hypothetical protein